MWHWGRRPSMVQGEILRSLKCCMSRKVCKWRATGSSWALLSHEAQFFACLSQWCTPCLYFSGHKFHLCLCARKVQLRQSHRSPTRPHFVSPLAWSSQATFRRRREPRFQPLLKWVPVPELLQQPDRGTTLLEHQLRPRSSPQHSLQLPSGSKQSPQRHPWLAQGNGCFTTWITRGITPGTETLITTIVNVHPILSASTISISSIFSGAQMGLQG